MYLPCPKRQKIIIVNADGAREEGQQCTEPLAQDAYGKFVTPEVCAACKVRGKAPIKKEAKPAKPKKPAQSAPKPNEPHACLDMKQVVQVKCCGDVIKKMYCNSEQSVYNGQQVSKNICAACPVRRPAS